MTENIMITTSEQVVSPQKYIDELKSIKDKIESMPKFNQIEVLRLLTNSTEVTLNENKYGVHINLTEVGSHIINELKLYINYVNAQEVNLTEMELQKEQFKNIYFTNNNKDNSTNCHIDG